MSQDPSLPKFEIPLNDKGGNTSKNWYFFFQGLLNSLFSLTVTDGTTTVQDVETIKVAGGTVTTTGAGEATITVTGGGSSGVEFTDGTNTVNGATKLTVTGGTIGGTTPNATLNIASGGSLSVTDGTHTVTPVTSIDFAGAVVSGTTPNATVTISGSGTVTSVGLADTSTAPIYNVTGSPVTTSGTVDLTLKTQTANTVFAGPASGSAAQPGFRAIQVSDLPVIGFIPGGVPDLVFWWESDNIQASVGAPLNRLQERTPWILGLAAQTSVIAANCGQVSATQINGLTTLKFPTTGIASYQFPVAIPLTDATFFVVINPATTTGAQAIIGGPGNSTAFYLCGTTGSPHVSLVKTSSSIIGNSTATWTVGTPFQANATYTTATGAYAFRQSRSAAGSGTGAASAGGNSSLFGADVSNSTNFLNAASIAAVIVYHRVLTSPEITSVENYLFAKWGV